MDLAVTAHRHPTHVLRAAGLIAAGSADIVVAGGAENMSRVPMGSNREIHGEAFGWMASERYELTSQGEGAERMASKRT
ncbi:thiolase family protein, partial [Pseudomonas aeruginosa]